MVSKKNVEITVTNTGVGMNAEEIAVLFRIDWRHEKAGTAKEFTILIS
ncbi:MAG TPA: hypothetical protein VK186_04850 [Candidatus Deferrimicrobium sp.]|nr:hypothetical protein [Candidatus Kapabacteria bacterium]HLP58133.1 hypothetical protein [Candidatus Deferrimicrobium sp.]